MKYRITIAGEPVIDIFEGKNGRCWFITKKSQKYGQHFLSGYVRCLKPDMLAEFCHLPEEIFDDMGDAIWKVPEDAWHRCPCVDIEEDRSSRKIVRFKGRDTDARPLGSYSSHCKGVSEKMDSDTKERLDDYIELFDAISDKTEEFSIAAAILHEMAKDRRAEQMRNERQGKSGNGATAKQKRLMKQLGLDFPENISRKEASVMITEELDRIHEAEE